MNEKLRCPYLDMLGRQLIEAYRSLVDSGAPQRSSGSVNTDAVQEAIIEHRQICSLCRAINGISEKSATPQLLALVRDPAVSQANS